MANGRLRRAARILVVAAIGTAFVSVPATQAAAANQTVNGGFEAGNTSGWTCTSATVVSSPVHSGTRALSGTPTGSSEARCSQTVSVVPSSSYTLSAFVQGSYVFIGATGTGTTDPSNWTPSAPTYTQLSTSFTTGASTTSVTIFVHGWYGQPTYFADDIVLDGAGGGGGPTPTVPGTPGGLRVTGTTADSVSLAWNTASGTVSGYNVYRDGARVDTVTGTSTTVGGLSASTTFNFQVSAFNSAGESPRSATVPGTTQPGGGGGPLPGGNLPAHFLTGYWHNFNNGSTTMRLSSVPAQYDLIAVAFADATGTPGAVTFNVDPGLSSALGGYTNAQLAADVRTLQGQGRKVIISVGGQNGTVSVSSSTAATNFANSLFGLMQQFGFNGVDIDLENGVNAQFMGQALRQLRSMAGSGLIITMAPQTLDMQSTGTQYFQLALNIKDILTVVHTQYYNSGSMLGCDQGVYSQATVNFMTALACIQLEGGLRPDQVALGLPATSRAAGGGFQSPTNVNNALNCLARGQNCGSFRPPRTYPGIRGAMTWSINWDATNGNSFANTVGPFLDTLP